MATPVERVARSVTSTVHQETIQAPLVSVLRRAEIALSAYSHVDVPANATKTLLRAGIQVAPNRTTAHSHPASYTLEKYMILKKVASRIYGPCSFLSIKDHKIEQIVAAMPDAGRAAQHEVLDYALTVADLSRYPTARNSSPPAPTKPYLFGHDILQHLTALDIMILFSSNPDLETAYFTLPAPLELLTRSPSFWPDIYTLTYPPSHPDLVQFNPDGNEADSYFQEISQSLFWLRCSGIGEALSPELTVDILDSAFHYHVVAITRTRTVPRPLRSFMSPGLSRLPDLLFPGYPPADLIVPESYLKKGLLYVLSAKAPSVKDVDARIRSYMGSDLDSLTAGQYITLTRFLAAVAEAPGPTLRSWLVPTSASHALALQLGARDFFQLAALERSQAVATYVKEIGDLRYPLTLVPAPHHLSATDRPSLLFSNEAPARTIPDIFRIVSAIAKGSPGPEQVAARMTLDPARPFEATDENDEVPTPAAPPAPAAPPPVLADPPPAPPQPAQPLPAVRPLPGPARPTVRGRPTRGAPARRGRNHGAADSDLGSDDDEGGDPVRRLRHDMIGLPGDLALDVAYLLGGAGLFLGALYLPTITERLVRELIRQVAQTNVRTLARRMTQLFAARRLLRTELAQVVVQHLRDQFSTRARRVLGTVGQSVYSSLLDRLPTRTAEDLTRTRALLEAPRRPITRRVRLTKPAIARAELADSGMPIPVPRRNVCLLRSFSHGLSLSINHIWAEFVERAGRDRAAHVSLDCPEWSEIEIRELCNWLRCRVLVRTDKRWQGDRAFGTAGPIFAITWTPGHFEYDPTPVDLTEWTEVIQGERRAAAPPPSPPSPEPTPPPSPEQPPTPPSPTPDVSPERTPSPEVPIAARYADLFADDGSSTGPELPEVDFADLGAFVAGEVPTNTGADFHLGRGEASPNAIPRPSRASTSMRSQRTTASPPSCRGSTAEQRRLVSRHFGLSLTHYPSAPSRRSVAVPGWSTKPTPASPRSSSATSRTASSASSTAMPRSCSGSSRSMPCSTPTRPAAPSSAPALSAFLAQARALTSSARSGRSAATPPSVPTASGSSAPRSTTERSGAEISPCPPVTVSCSRPGKSQSSALSLASFSSTMRANFRQATSTSCSSSTQASRPSPSPVTLRNGPSSLHVSTAVFASSPPPSTPSPPSPTATGSPLTGWDTVTLGDLASRLQALGQQASGQLGPRLHDFQCSLRQSIRCELSRIAPTSPSPPSLPSKASPSRPITSCSLTIGPLTWTTALSLSL
nr:methyltransferase [Rhizoctonia zeae gammaflexivirus 1]